MAPLALCTLVLLLALGCQATSPNSEPWSPAIKIESRFAQGDVTDLTLPIALCRPSSSVAWAFSQSVSFTNTLGNPTLIRIESSPVDSTVRTLLSSPVGQTYNGPDDGNHDASLRILDADLDHMLNLTLSKLATGEWMATLVDATAHKHWQLGHFGFGHDLGGLGSRTSSLIEYRRLNGTQDVGCPLMPHFTLDLGLPYTSSHGGLNAQLQQSKRLGLCNHVDSFPRTLVDDTATDEEQPLDRDDVVDYESLSQDRVEDNERQVPPATDESVPHDAVLGDALPDDVNTTGHLDMAWATTDSAGPGSVPHEPSGDAYNDYDSEASSLQDYDEAASTQEAQHSLDTADGVLAAEQAMFRTVYVTLTRSPQPTATPNAAWDLPGSQNQANNDINNKDKMKPIPPKPPVPSKKNKGKKNSNKRKGSKKKPTSRKRPIVPVQEKTQRPVRVAKLSTAKPQQRHMPAHSSVPQPPQVRPGPV
ncbi:hypothetical protein CDD81_2315 [Ophiocordyceps australis]|uniref:Uncharacterized protein n=1 Tax=Ophiocordyceps australis TaxID=1399860 RepID=A0A2C5Y7R9_9HYPO|nr:hypothetical protein CDD81_2315 [Ophiocordyceps australis]